MTHYSTQSEHDPLTMFAVALRLASLCRPPPAVSSGISPADPSSDPISRGAARPGQHWRQGGGFLHISNRRRTE